MKIHREGYPTISWAVIISGVLILGAYSMDHRLTPYATGLAVLLLVIVLQFFRDPNRKVGQTDDSLILAPADGKVVVMEEVDDPLMDGLRSLQISIFMSPVNVHINRVPINGILSAFKYYPGKFMPAWNPKSSFENERTELRIKSSLGDIGLKQIAGAMARRIVCYKQDAGMELIQGEELGFIKFGSRVDLLLPLGLQVDVRIGDKVSGNRTVIARKA